MCGERVRGFGFDLDSHDDVIRDGLTRLKDGRCSATVSFVSPVATTTAKFITPWARTPLSEGLPTAAISTPVSAVTTA